MTVPSAPVRPRLAVTLYKNTVTLEIICADRYAAMELYDQACAGARQGHMQLDVETQQRDRDGREN